VVGGEGLRRLYHDGGVAAQTCRKDTPQQARIQIAVRFCTPQTTATSAFDC
jgi:hypothetical protein